MTDSPTATMIADMKDHFRHFHEPWHADTLGVLVVERDALQAMLDKLAAKMSHRRCHDCGFTDYYASGVIPACNCSECGSSDTRIVRTKQPERKS